MMALGAGRAEALSCMPWSVEAAYASAEKAKERYYLIRGTFALSDADMVAVAKAPGKFDHGGMSEGRVMALLSGKTITRVGVSHKVEGLPVALEINCWMGSCGPQITSGGEYLAFVRKTADGYALRQGPCGWFAFPDPSADMMKRVRACVRDRGCVAPGY